MTAALGVLAATLTAVAVAWWLDRRALARRLASVAADLADQVARQAVELERVSAACQRLEAATDALAEGVAVWDGNGELAFCNERATPYLLARHEDVLAERAVRQLVAQARAGIVARQTVELYGPPRRVLEVQAAPAKKDPLLGIVAVIDDVTERQRLEAIRRDFVANISHELRTPVGALALLAETLVSEHDPTVIDRLSERILIESQRVSRIIDDLLDLSRIESERSLAKESIGLEVVVAESVERVQSAAERHSVTLDLGRVPPDLKVLGERRQLVSAVCNLLDNAIKYSDEGSVVEVRTTGNGYGVELVVRDHGIGIPARDLERVFERFYRVDPARSRDTGGTGLGLAIVRHVAHNHGGEVFVESVEGEGSTFTLRLPADPQKIAASEAEVQ